MYMYQPSNQVPTQNTGIATHMACPPRDSVLGSATAPSSMITRTARFLKEHPSRARATPQSHSLAFVLQTIAVCALQTMTSDFTELSCHKELALGIGISALLQIGKVRLDPLENEDPRTDGLTLVTTSKCPPRHDINERALCQLQESTSYLHNVSNEIGESLEDQLRKKTLAEPLSWEKTCEDPPRVPPQP